MESGVAVIELSEDINSRPNDENKSLLPDVSRQQTGYPQATTEEAAKSWNDRLSSCWGAMWHSDFWSQGGLSCMSRACFLKLCFVFQLILIFLLLGALAIIISGLLKADTPDVHFLVIGDWGRQGGQNQTAVAAAMARKADSFHPEFVISVGDNFYESGLNSADDPQFTTTFTDVYSQSSLQVPWYAVLGNHDYGEWWEDTKGLKECPQSAKDCYLSPLHQLNKRLRERDKRWRCERWYGKRMMGGQAEIFFIDTNPFILDYHSQPWANNTGGILEQSWESQIFELDARLAASEAKWKLVVGHHPVRNQHMPENTPELMQHLEPILEAQGVQAYFSGHEHNLQYMHVETHTTHYIVSGAGSLTDYPAKYWNNGGGRFQHQGSGFVSCSLSLKQLRCTFHGIANDILYQITVDSR